MIFNFQNLFIQKIHKKNTFVKIIPDSASLDGKFLFLNILIGKVN
jgi:hypothetical protein